jgi:hypothetical protein
MTQEAAIVHLSVPNERALTKLFNIGVHYIFKEKGSRVHAPDPFRAHSFYFISKEEDKATPTISLVEWSKLCIVATAFHEGRGATANWELLVGLLSKYSGLPIEGAPTEQETRIRELLVALFGFALIRPKDLEENSPPPEVQQQPGDLSQLVSQRTTNTAGAANGIEEEQQSTEAVDDTEIHHQLDRLPTDVFSPMRDAYADHPACCGITKYWFDQRRTGRYTLSDVDCLQSGLKVLIAQATANQFLFSDTQSPIKVQRPNNWIGCKDDWDLFRENDVPVLRARNCTRLSSSERGLCHSCRTVVNSNFYRLLRALADMDGDKKPHKFTANCHLSLNQKDVKLATQAHQIRMAKQQIRRLQEVVTKYRATHELETDASLVPQMATLLSNKNLQDSVEEYFDGKKWTRNDLIPILWKQTLDNAIQKGEHGSRRVRYTPLVIRFAVSICRKLGTRMYDWVSKVLQRHDQFSVKFLDKRRENSAVIIKSMVRGASPINGRF